MADNNEPRQIRVIKNIGTRIKYFPPKRTEGLGSRKRDIPSSDKDEPRRIRVIKNVGTRMKYFPPKAHDGLQRWANSKQPNNPDRNGKAQDEAQPNAEQE